MVDEDLSTLGSLELMRRLVAMLPEGSSEQAQLFGVIKGLSTVGYSDRFGKGKRWETGAEGQAKQVLRAILPKLSEDLPGNPLLAELAKRYAGQPGKR
jgi:hypothetical protein